MNLDDILSVRVREALLTEWDPIGVREFANAHDEYDSYVPEVCELLARPAHLDEIVAYLWWLETEHMGLRGDRKKTEAFAAHLANLREQTSK